MLSVFTKIHCEDQITKLRNQLQKQSRSFKEILHTQTHYVCFLLFVKDEFQNIIKQLGMPLELYQQLFRGIDKIYQLHRQLLEGLENISKIRSKCLKLSQLFNKYIPYFVIYKDYFDTLEYRRELVAELKEKQKLNNYNKTMRKYAEDKKHQEKYGADFVSYISKIQLIDCLSKPFQRYHQYQLLIQNYIRFVNPASIHLKDIKATADFLKAQINKINTNLISTNQKTVAALEKKYGGLIRLHAIYYENMKVEWYHRSKVESGRLYVFDKVLLIVSEDNREKELKRVVIGEHSYFHHFRVGRNFTTEIFVKGLNGHLTLFIEPERFQSFIQLVKNLIGGADQRKSWDQDILSKIKSNANLENNCVIFRPISVSKYGNKYRYGVSFQIQGTIKTQLSFFTVNQLNNIANSMVDSGYDVETLKEATGVDIDGEMDQYYAEQLALGLFQYFSPLMSNFGDLRKNSQLQNLLNLNQLVKWYLQKEKDGDDNDQNDLFSLQQDRLRLKYDISQNPCVEVTIWVTYNKQIKIKVGKNQRVYQIVKDIFGQNDFTFDFTLFMGENRQSCRLLDDDQILYLVLKQEGWSFREQQGFFSKGLNLLSRKQQPNIYLKKYLHLQTTFVNTYKKQSYKRYSLLVEDIIDKLIKNSDTINGYKLIQRLGMLFSITTKQLNNQHAKVVAVIWNSIYSRHQELSESIFKNNVQSKFVQYQYKNPQYTLSELLNQLKHYHWYSFHVYGRLKNDLVNIYVSCENIEVRQWKTPQKLIFKIQIRQLSFSVSPTYIKIRDIINDYVVEVDDVYGLVLALERNININRLLQ